MRISAFIAAALYLPSIVTSTPSSSLFGVVGVVPRGGQIEESSSYATVCEEVKSAILERANQKIAEWRKAVIEEGSIIPSFGQTADALCNEALTEFANTTPPSTDDANATLLYNQKLSELAEAIDAPLQVLYMKQLASIRDVALQNYKASTKTSETSDYEAMLQADASFTAGATDLTRQEAEWTFASDRAHLQTIMNDIASTRKQLVDTQMRNSEKQSTAMAFLQQQQQMIQQLQMQLYGQSSPWNMGMAYRIPDTNLNVQGSYQQGRANVQLSCVPDEYAPMLGANGFTNGVGPGNLGLSLNLSV